MIVDFHLHVPKKEMYYPWVHEYMAKMNPKVYRDYESYMNPTGVGSVLEEAGVDYGVVLAEIAPAATGILSNEYVVEFCKGADRLIPFGSLNPYTTPDPAGELERLVGGLGVRGLKLYPSYQMFYPNSAELYPLYAKAETLGIPIMFHTGTSIFRGSRLKFSQPLHLDDVAVDFPKLKIIQAHGGRGFWYEEAYFLTRIHENVYLEISGLPPKNLLKYYPDLEKVADKVIFGSDWPAADIKANIEGIRALPLSAKAKRKILGENAGRILKIGG